MDLVQLRALVEIARYGSFSQAARNLGQMQSGVSRQVKQLERELGFLLIDRERRPVALTPAGAEFVSWAKNIVSELDAIIQRLGGRPQELAGPLTVVASTIPGEFLVPGLLARFTAQHSFVRPSLMLTDSAGVVNELLAGKAEVGFLGAPMVNKRLRLIPFAQDEVVLAVPLTHPYAQRESVALADLGGQPIVEREGGSGTLDSLHRMLTEQGTQLPAHEVPMITGTSQAQLTAIEAGMGLGFVSSLVLANRPNTKVTGVRIEGIDLSRTLYLSHEQGRLSPVAHAFVHFVIEASASFPSQAHAAISPVG